MRRDGCLTAVLVALSLAVVCLGGALLYVVLTTQPSSGGADGDVTQAELEPKSFGEYTWDELSQVARLISEAQTDEEGRALASEWGIEVGDARPVPLDDGTQATLTVVGIRQDERADGAGPAGITLMLATSLRQPMNQEETCLGGWEASELRAWLADEGMDLLPDELAGSVASVTKLTNNEGVTSDASAVSETSDELWLFSLSEVCGEVTLFVDEYGDDIRARLGYEDFSAYDALLSAEGEQYAYFSQAGVTSSSAGTGVLAISNAGGWWYRTAYPFTILGDDAYFFYQTMESGYPATLGYASEPAGVVVGLCL